MKGTKLRPGRTGFFLSIGLVSGCMASALPPDRQGTPYHQIAERNAFHLAAFEPPTGHAPPMIRIPAPKITLTGITTILGRKFAFITIAGIRAGQGPVSLMLGEGQTLNEVGVKSIDEKAGLVRVINHGELQTLGFEQDGAKSSSPAPNPAPRPQPVLSDAPLSQEEQIALIEIQRVKYQQENNPLRNILPRPKCPLTGLAACSRPKIRGQKRRFSGGYFAVRN